MSEAVCRSAADFQSALARLITDPDFRDRVRENGAQALPSNLTELERRRLLAAAPDPGLDITRTLHKGFRLGKLLNQLPLTGALLGDDLLAREVGEFWRQRIPRSFYFIEEAVAFCDYLLERAREDLAVEYLEEVVGYERASCYLKQPRPECEAPAPQRVSFSHDPTVLLGALASGTVPTHVPRATCFLEAELSPEGEIEWVILSEALSRHDPTASAATRANQG